MTYLENIQNSFKTLKEQKKCLVSCGSIWDTVFYEYYEVLKYFNKRLEWLKNNRPEVSNDDVVLIIYRYIQANVRKPWLTDKAKVILRSLQLKKQCSYEEKKHIVPR